MQQIDPNRSASLAASGAAEWTDADCTDRRQKAKTPARVAEQYSRLMGELGGQRCRPPRLAAGPNKNGEARVAAGFSVSPSTLRSLGLLGFVDIAEVIQTDQIDPDFGQGFLAAGFAVDHA